MPWPCIPPRGKREKRLYFSPHCGDETTTYPNRAKRKAADRDSINAKAFEEKGEERRGIRFCNEACGFHLYSTVKMRPFSPVFPLADFMAEAFCRLFLCSFKVNVPEKRGGTPPLLQKVSPPLINTLLFLKYTFTGRSTRRARP